MARRQIERQNSHIFTADQFTFSEGKYVTEMSDLRGQPIDAEVIIVRDAKGIVHLYYRIADVMNDGELVANVYYNHNPKNPIEVHILND